MFSLIIAVKVIFQKNTSRQISQGLEGAPDANPTRQVSAGKYYAGLRAKGKPIQRSFKSNA